MPAYGFAYFSPAIIKEYGYGNTQTQLHSVAPWASAFVFAMIVAYASDKLRHRFIFTLLPISVAVTGFIMLLQEYKDTDTEYAALFLVTMGTYSAMPVIVCWFNMNLGGHYRRSIGSAWQISFGNIGAVVATYAFLLPDAPRYVRGFSLCLGFIAFSAVSCVVYFLLCSAENRRRDKLATNSSLTDHDRQRLGDLSPDYRYLL